MNKGIRLAVVLAVVTVALGLLAGCGRNTPDVGNAAIHSPVASSGQAGEATDPSRETQLPEVSAGQGEPAANSSGQPSSPSSSGAAQAASSGSLSDAQPAPSDETSPDSRPAASSSVHAGSESGTPSVPAGPESGSASPAGNPGSGSAASSGQPNAPSGQPASPPASPQGANSTEPKADAVTISVFGNEEWGTVLESESVKWKDGDTVADLLIRALKSRKLAYETRGSGALFYVTGIDGLFEFDDGPTSGWKYRVNGEVIGRSAGAFKAQPGDRITWFYAPDDEDVGEIAP